MENIFISTLRYAFQFIESFIAETSIGLLLFGLIFLIIGVFVIFITIINIFFSPRINGRVAGAVNAIYTKEKLKNGKLVKRSKTLLYPIYEYSQEDGSSRYIRGSNAGSHVLKYKTGQEIKFIINDGRFDSEGIDTAVDLDDRRGFYVGLFFTALGSAMVIGATDILASLTIGFIAIIGIAISLLFKLKDNIKPSKKKKETIFDFNDMRPIEEFIEESTDQK